MKNFILIQKSSDGKPVIVRDSDGQLQWFSTKAEAVRFSADQKLLDYEIFRLHLGEIDQKSDSLV
ncbi:hypothetical protein [Larkinella terrae]|uniref:Uncharacterized protein n=1 Tax=Larkinella terrae TaxID=2025311 RepID=A0A7K0EMP3_9BACT|nr:hypothetical protein [Larkinella terrae]MRS62811.1 hypothetical protein [Larkinella terrae]